MTFTLVIKQNMMKDLILNFMCITYTTALRIRSWLSFRVSRWGGKIRTCDKQGVVVGVCPRWSSRTAPAIQNKWQKLKERKSSCMSIPDCLYVFLSLPLLHKHTHTHTHTHKYSYTHTHCAFCLDAGKYVNRKLVHGTRTLEVHPWLLITP